MFCGEILFSPVLSEGAEKQTVIFPAGSWYGIFDGSVCTGGQALEIPVTREYSPAYIRSGSLIPVRISEGLELMTAFEDENAVYALLITPPNKTRQHRYYKSSEVYTDFTVKKTKDGFSVSSHEKNGFKYAIILCETETAECDGIILEKRNSVKDLCNKDGYTVSDGKTYIHSENGFNQLTISL